MIEPMPTTVATDGVAMPTAKVSQELSELT